MAPGLLLVEGKPFLHFSGFHWASYISSDGSHCIELDGRHFPVVVSEECQLEEWSGLSSCGDLL